MQATSQDWPWFGIPLTQEPAITVILSGSTPMPSAPANASCSTSATFPVPSNVILTTATATKRKIPWS